MAGSREKVVQSAERYVSRGKIEAAIKEYRKLLADNPNDISTLNRVGDLYARINRNSEAIDLFTQIATQYADDGFFVKAIAIYKKIIKLDPTLLEVYESLADLYHRQGLVNEARTQYQVLADYYVKHGRTMAAIAIYRRMAELEPDDPSHHVKLAELYREEDRTEEAMGEYRAIADLMLHHGKGQEAARVFERALDVDAQDLGFITDAVLKLKEGGHVGPAAHLLAVAVEKNPKAERVARLAGLPDRSAAREAPAVRPEPEPVAEPEEAAPEAEAAAEPAPEEPVVEEPDEEGTEPALAAEEELPALEAEDAPFSLDLDEEGFESQVVPPPDMLEDRERPGAAWVEGARPAPEETAEAEAPGLEEAVPEEPAVAAGPEPHAVREGLTGTFEFELDLDADGAELLTEVPDEVAARAGGPRDDDELDHELLERTAAEVHIAVHPEEGGEAEDLLAEAEVLAKYGIEEKALERLAELLQREPANLDAHRLMIGLHLEAGRHERVAALAGPFSELAGRLDDRRVWPELRERLESAGYRVAPGRVEPPPAEEAAVVEPAVEPEAEAAEAPLEPAEPDLEPTPEAAPEAEAFELDLDADRYELPEIDWEGVPEEPAAIAEPEEVVEAAEATEPVVEEPLLEEAPPEAAAPELPEEAAAQAPPSKKRRRLADLDAALAEIAGQFLRRKPRRPHAEEPIEAAEAVEPAFPAEAEEPPTFAPAAEAPPPDAVAPVDPLRALGDSLRAEIGGTGDGEVPAAAGATDLSRPDPDDTGMSWLDEVAAAPGPERVIPDETGFFDLGAELEQELSAEGELSADELLVGPAEQSLEEIVEGFKRGVAENLSPEDYDTHFNLGIAYREMGLLDEAIGEFQLAAKEPSYLVTCASMLGLCFREKGLPELAVKWFRRGLEAPGISEEDRLGLLYDLGDAHAEAGERKAAYETFVDVYGVNTNYRDVVARLAELEPRR
jgi:tetratricopeptide (TPR) repeat protein